MSTNMEASLRPFDADKSVKHHAMFGHMMLNQLTQLLLLVVTLYSAFSSEGSSQALFMLASSAQAGILFVTRVAVMTTQAVKYKSGNSLNLELKSLRDNIQPFRYFFAACSAFVAALSYAAIQDLSGNEKAAVAALFVIAITLLMDNSIKGFGQLCEELTCTPSGEDMEMVK
ncbi:MAG: hypothetical protein CBC55_00805 [Gammaproteobacteria bacterium TMED95]|nr:MAG: hypothetical protein CBC55_00805 [Gammaproteobacteria bacterium TMED95]